jgi:hypothetical protein
MVSVLVHEPRRLRRQLGQRRRTGWERLCGVDSPRAFEFLPSGVSMGSLRDDRLRGNLGTAQPTFGAGGCCIRRQPKRRTI